MLDKVVSDMQQHYTTFGLQMGASKNEIRDTFRSLAKKYHPDYNPGDPESEEAFKKVASAYAFLMGRGTSAPAQQSCAPASDLGYTFILFPWLLCAAFMGMQFPSRN